MKRMLVLILGFLLVGCSAKPGISSQLSSTTSASVPTVMVAPSPLPSTLTPFLPLPDTETPTLIPSERPVETPSETLTETSTETPVSWIYVFPVQPSSLADFAEGVTSHGYPATDIFAPEGTKFVAVTNGVVDFVSYEDQWEPVWDKPSVRGGLSVAIIGDDGTRYYGSHLSAIKAGIRPGVRVTTGQVLGYVGHTGDALTSDFHLHFGISSPTYPEDWRFRRGKVDPFPFLVAWRKGINLTPPLPEASKNASTETASLFTYVFPVQPVKNVNFSEGRHGYPATDIFAPAGSQFVAVTDGMVDRISNEDLWDPATNDPSQAGGLWVSFLGDDGVRYFGAHLSAIADGIRSGVRASAGDVLGLVGNTGNARSTLPHLHFEISRPTPAYDWMSRDSLIDPFTFLQAWKTGQNVSPSITP